MKKITLIVALNVLIVCSAVATERVTFAEWNKNRGMVSFNDHEPIAFLERGVVFYVFLNGDFDFNTHPQEHHNGNFLRRGYSARAHNHNAINYGVRIEHDSFGRIRRVGNTFINYDTLNRVTRIGNVFMRYNNFGLAQIGGTQIAYSARGRVTKIVGAVHFTRGNTTVATHSYYGPSTGIQKEYSYPDNTYYYKNRRN